MGEANLGSIPEADEVVVQLDRFVWKEVFEPTYRDWFETAPSRKKDWAKKEEKIRASIARRVKYEGLMGSVVAKGHVGLLAAKTIYGTDYIRNIGYEVLSTKPEGEVRIAEKTKLVLKFE